MAQGPNPFVYIFPAVLLVGVTLYFAYGTLDRAGLRAHEGEARVTGKQYGPPSTTYHTNVVAGRTVTQAQQNPETFIVTLDLDGVQTGGAVARDLYESLQAGERVRVKYKKTRISQRVLVTSVSR